MHVYRQNAPTFRASIYAVALTRDALTSRHMISQCIRLHGDWVVDLLEPSLSQWHGLSMYYRAQYELQHVTALPHASPCSSY